MTVNHDATGSSPVTGAKKPHSQAVCGVFALYVGGFRNVCPFVIYIVPFTPPNPRRASFVIQ